MHIFVTTNQQQAARTVSSALDRATELNGSLTYRTQICMKWQNGCLSQFLLGSGCLHDTGAACHRGCRLFSVSKASKTSWKSKK